MIKIVFVLGTHKTKVDFYLDLKTILFLVFDDYSDDVVKYIAFNSISTIVILGKHELKECSDVA